MSSSTIVPAPAARVVDLLAPERPGGRSTPYGSVWDVVSEPGLGAALVVKDGEEIDPGWFSQPAVDLLLLLRGRLRVEFEGGTPRPLTMRPGHLLVLEPGTRCRAYRWPRSSPRAAVFLAVYPEAAAAPGEVRAHGPEHRRPRQPAVPGAPARRARPPSERARLTG